MKTYRIGIVGTTHLSSHVSALKPAPRVKLVAAAAHTDTERDRFKSTAFLRCIQATKKC